MTKNISISFSIYAEMPKAAKGSAEISENEKLDLMRFDDFYTMDINESF